MCRIDDVLEPTAAAVTPWAARRVRPDWEQLRAATTRPVPFDLSIVAGMPEPAPRYLTHHRGGDSAVAVRGSGHGGEDQAGCVATVTASQVVAPARATSGRPTLGCSASR